MYNLIKLEIKKNNLSVYLRSACFILLGALAFLYLFAVIPLMDSGVGVSDTDVADTAIFSSYRSISIIVGILEMCSFSLLGAVMYSKILIEEYTGKRVYLLFSYPVNRKRVFAAKFLLVMLCTTGLMIAGNVVVYGIFYSLELLFGIVPDTVNFATLLYTLCSTVILAFLSAAIALLSARIGFHKKSVRFPLVIAVVICCCLSNVLTLALTYDFVLPIIFSVFTIVGLVALFEFARTISKMEECA